MPKKSVNLQDILEEALLASLPVALFCKDYTSGKGEFVKWNQAATNLWGLKESEVLGKTDFDFFPKDQAEFFQAKDNETLDKGELVFIEEEPVDSPVGGKRIVRTWKVPVKEGEKRLLLGISLDITEQKNRERELQDQFKERSTILKMVFDSLDDGIVVANSKGEFELWNEVGAKLVGIGETDKKADQRSKTYKIYEEDGKTPMLEKDSPLVRAIQGESTSGKRLQLKNVDKPNGTLLKVDGRPIMSDGKPQGGVVVFKDVTEADRTERIRRAAQDIRLAYSKFTGNFPKLSELILEKYLSITESEYGFVGEILEKDGKPYLKTLAITDISWNEETKTFYEENIASGLEFFNLDTLFGWVIKKGELLITNDPPKDKRAAGIPVGHPELKNFCGIPLFHKDKFIAMVGLANSEFDYSQKLVDEIKPIVEESSDILALAKVESEKLDLATVVRYAGFAIITIDLKGNIKTWNPQAEKLFGWKRDEIFGKSIKTITPEDHLHETKEFVKRVLGGELVHEETVRMSKSGERIPIELHLSPITNGEGSIESVASHILDIREKKELEQQLFHSSKLASIGELAAGVGHEINNPLAILSGNLHTLKHRFEKEGLEEFIGVIDKCNVAAWRIANIVQGLRTFARADSESKSTVDIRKLIEQTVSLVAEIYQKEGIKLSLRSPEGEAILFEGNLGRIQQAIMNLISNARDATEGSSDRKISIEIMCEEKQFKISVKDNGRGIPENVKDKIFDNFFTTKEIGKGMGMGLALSANIIKQHSGRIWFESKVGKGTEFIVEFPRAAREGTKKQKGSKTQEIYVPSRVLLVDDEPLVREVLRDILEIIGVESIEEANNGKEALEAVSKNEAYDVIFTDLKMPVMDGPTLLKRLRSNPIRGNPLLIAVTGGITNDFTEKDRDHLSFLVDGYILKPFKQNDVEETLSKGREKRFEREADRGSLGEASPAAQKKAA